MNSNPKTKLQYVGHRVIFLEYLLREIKRLKSAQQGHRTLSPDCKKEEEVVVAEKIVPHPRLSSTKKAA